MTKTELASSCGEAQALSRVHLGSGSWPVLACLEQLLLTLGIKNDFPGYGHGTILSFFFAAFAG